MFKKMRRDEAVFLIVLALWMVVSCLGFTRWDVILELKQVRSILKIIMLIACGGILIFGEKKTAIEYIALIMFLGLAFLVNWRVEGVYDDVVWITGMLMVCSYKANYKRMLTVSMVCILVTFAFTLWSVWAGKIEMQYWLEGNKNLDLGYKYSTYPAYMILFVCIMYIMIRKWISWIEIIAICGIQFIMYKVTDTSATLIATAIMMLCIVIYKIGRLFRINKDQWINGSWRIFTLFPFGAMVMSFLVNYLYNPNVGLWARLNEIFVHRLELGKNAIQTYDISLFGDYIKWVGVGSITKDPTLVYNYVDNYYLKYLLTFGIIYQLVILVGLTVVIYLAGKNKKYGVIFGMVGMLAYGMVDAEMMDIRFHSMVLLIGCAYSLMENRNEKV